MRQNNRRWSPHFIRMQLVEVWNNASKIVYKETEWETKPRSETEVLLAWPELLTNP